MRKSGYNQQTPTSLWILSIFTLGLSGFICLVFIVLALALSSGVETPRPIMPEEPLRNGTGMLFQELQSLPEHQG